VTFSADSAHNVPLQILAGGGLVAGATYLAFVGVVAVLLVKGLRRLDGDAYLLLAGVGGCWVAYHSQALVSIDVPPLAALHWVLAGAVVALAQPSLLAKPGSAGGKRRGRRIPSGAVPAVLVPLVLVVMWLATVPQRAELRAGTAARLAAAGQHAAAVQRYEEAASTWDSAAIYWTELGYSSQQLQDGEAALQAFGAALDRDGRAIEPAISAGRTAAALGLREQAVRWYATAKDIDPHHPAVAVEYGRALLAAGNLEGAVEEAKAALVVDPNYQDAAELLQQARMGP
jgi:tetratricopeptide (TPR) repeat protein